MVKKILNMHINKLYVFPILHASFCIEALIAYILNSLFSAPEKSTNITFMVNDKYFLNNSEFGDITLQWRPPKHAGNGNDVSNYTVLFQKDVDKDKLHYLRLLVPHRGVHIIPGVRELPQDSLIIS